MKFAAQPFGRFWKKRGGINGLAALAMAAWVWSFCWGIAGAQGGPLETMLIAPSMPASPGQKATVVVLFKNPGTTPVLFSPPDAPQIELVSGHGQQKLPATWMAAEKKSKIRLAPGGYVEMPIQIAIPEKLAGYVRIRSIRPPSEPVIMEISLFPLAQTAETASEAPAQEPEVKLKTMESKIQPYFSNLFFYEPIYFLVGTDPGKSKFQLSFKYSLFRNDSPLAEKHPLFKGLHFAYTQTSFWDLKSDSAPFEDTSYKPEIFYVSPNFDLKIPRLYTSNLQIGARHESNGRGGTQSRSTNTLYVKPIFMFAGKGEESGIMLAPKFMAYVGNDSHTNPDLPDYRGHFDLEIKTGFLKSFVFDTHLRYGQQGGSAQFDLTHPMPAVLGDNIDLYFYAQYFTGYAESLLHYDRKESALRFGFSIAR